MSQSKKKSLWISLMILALAVAGVMAYILINNPAEPFDPHAGQNPFGSLSGDALTNPKVINPEMINPEVIDENVDLQKLKQTMDSLNQSLDQEKAELLELEKAIAEKDQAMKQRIDALSQQPGLSEEEFQSRFGEIIRLDPEEFTEPLENNLIEGMETDSDAESNPSP